MYVVLTTLYPDNPSIADWLGIGGVPALERRGRDRRVAHTAAFVLGARPAAPERPRAPRDRARRRPSREPEPPPEPELRRPDPGPVAGRDGASASTSVDRPAAATRRRGRPSSRAAMPTWSERRPFSRGRASPAGCATVCATVPFRADRTACAPWRGRRAVRPARPVAPASCSFVATLGLRTFRLAEPAQMHFDEVYHARTATEFLQDWRYGLDHDIYEWTHPHLAKYAMAGGIVLWGEDDVSATSDLGVPVRAAAHRAAPRGPLSGRSCRRAGPRRDRHRDPDLRPAHPRARRRHRRRPGVGALAIDDDRRRCSSSASTTGRIGDARPADAIGPRRDRRRRSSRPCSRRVDHPVEHLLVTDDGATILAASDDRLTAVDVAEGTSPRHDRPARHRRPRAGGHGRVARRGRRRRWTTRRPSAATLAELLDGDAADVRGGARWRRPATDGQVVLGSPGDDESRDRRPGRRSTTGGWPAVDRRPAARRGRDGGRGHVPRPGHGRRVVDHRARGRRPRPGHGDRARRPEAVRDERPGRRPDLRRHGRRRRQRRGRPGRRSAATRCPGPGRGSPTTTPASWSTSWAGCRARPVRTATRGRSTSSSRTPITRRVRRRRAAGRPRAGGLGLDVESRVPERGPPAAPGVRRRTATTASIETGSHAFAWRLPGRHRRARSWRPALYLLARILFRRRLVAGLVARLRAARRDALRPVADRHERRLRRAVHRRRLHRLRRRLDGLVALALARPGWRCRAIGVLLGPRPRLEVGRGLRHRRAGAAAPGAQRARAGRWPSSG